MYISDFLLELSFFNERRHSIYGSINVQLLINLFFELTNLPTKGCIRFPYNMSGKLGSCVIKIGGVTDVFPILKDSSNHIQQPTLFLLQLLNIRRTKCLSGEFPSLFGVALLSKQIGFLLENSSIISARST